MSPWYVAEGIAFAMSEAYFKDSYDWEPLCLSLSCVQIVLESDLCDEITESPPAQSDAVVREVKATVSVAPVKTITDDRAECAPPRLESKSTSTTTTRSNSTVTETSNELDVEIGIPVLADGDGVVDRVESDEDDNDAEIDPCETGYLMLRSPRLKRPRPVPNCCAVCICPYEKDEVVVWSSNRHCKHAFHLDCMMDWLVKSFDGTPCPCCRQDFTDLVQYRIEQKIKWAPGYAFNPSVVVLRSSSNGRAAAVAAQPQQMTSPI
jgi:Anaphase-promoting complex subunit 11 RING-H2 finger